MQLFFNIYLALSIAGFAIIPSTANPVITHKPIPVGISLNATSTSLIPTTFINPGIPLQPSTITASVPTAIPTEGCEHSHFSPYLKNYLLSYLCFPWDRFKASYLKAMMKHELIQLYFHSIGGHDGIDKQKRWGCDAW